MVSHKCEFRSTQLESLKQIPFLTRIELVFFFFSFHENVHSSLRLQASYRGAPPLPSPPPPSDISHGHSHSSSRPYSLLRGQRRQADWLSTEKYFSVLSFFLSKVEPHPPQPQTKQVFYINPIATPRFQNTTSKVRFTSFIHPSSLPTRLPAPVCPHNMPSTFSDINNAMMLSHHSQSNR